MYLRPDKWYNEKVMRNSINPLVFYLFFFLVIVGLIFSDYQQHRQVEVQAEKEVQVEKTETTIETSEGEENKVIEDRLGTMTLEEKVGQLFWARVPSDHQIEDLQSYHLSGYILFGRDFEGRTIDDMKALTKDYQAAAKIPLLIGSDEEGGTVTRISSILETPFQSPMALYQRGGMEAVLSDTKQKAELLKSVGINAGLFPVADLARDQSAFIYDRTIGQDAQITASYVQQVVEELKKSKVGSTLKHFPGYGDNGDSHTAIIQDNRSLDELRQADFLPFQAGIDAGADSVLVSHNILSKIDTVPSSISPKITELLWKELHFKGVIMTDDFDMAGIADFVSQEEAAFQVILAGNDLILGSSYQTQIPYLLKKISSGELTEERIDESVRRILTWKYDLGLLGVSQ
ncbi:beta-hexosaminidase [Streptococcus mitis]|uniref:beta-N-acetylhexosaminidase n=2 Tax=Streptococcus mitis TaxID=28037 RepID=A0A1S9ZDC8_STRMT|nr:beta-hexosaminidase [Streptococcus mitis]